TIFDEFHGMRRSTLNGRFSLAFESASPACATLLQRGPRRAIIRGRFIDRTETLQSIVENPYRSPILRNSFTICNHACRLQSARLIAIAINRTQPVGLTRCGALRVSFTHP